MTIKTTTKEARIRYGQVIDTYRQSKTKRKTAEESLSFGVSILHDSYRNEEWAKKLRDRVRVIDILISSKQ